MRPFRICYSTAALLAVVGLFGCDKPVQQAPAQTNAREQPHLVEPATATPRTATAKLNASNGDSLETFWNEFRRAVADNDKERVADLATYPFQTRGGMDSDPVEKHDRKGFLRVYDRLMNQSVSRVVDEQLVSVSMRQLIVEHKDIPTVEGGTVRVGQLELKPIKGQWRLFYGYLEEE